MCFGGSQPAPQPLPASPTTNDSENLARVAAEKQKAVAAAGLGSTIITGGLGASDFDTAGKTKSGATVLGSTTQ